MGTQNPGIKVPASHTCHPEVWRAIQQIIQKLGITSSPKFGSAVISGDMTIEGILTLSNALRVSSGGTDNSTLTDHAVLLGSGTDPITPLGVATNGQLIIGSTGADPVLATITGTANRITSTPGAGTITLSTPQDIHTGASPTFAGLTVTNACVIGSNSVTFQPGTDSATFFQILDVDGGLPIVVVNAINERVGIRVSDPRTSLDIGGGVNVQYSNGYALGITAVLPNGVAGCYHTNGATDGVMRYYSNLGDIAFGSENCFNAIYIKKDTGYTGLGGATGETAPETMLELVDAAPYITLHNSTHEDTDGGRESRLIFKGEQSGGEETSLVQIEASHDGAADDQLGKIVLSVNTGTGLSEVLTINSGGDVFFTTAGSGLPYGSMYSISDMAVTMTTQNVWKEIDVATAWVTGKLNLCTFTDPYITVSKAGVYLVTWNIVARIGTAGQRVAAGIMIDQTVTEGPANGFPGVQGEGRGEIEFLNSSRRLGTSGSAILELTAGRKVSLAVRNLTSAGKVLTVSKGNLKVVQIGG